MSSTYMKPPILIDFITECWHEKEKKASSAKRNTVFLHVNPHLPEGLELPCFFVTF